MKRALIASMAVVAVMLATPAFASANVYGFSNDTQITIPEQGKASPYPSTIHVQGARGPVVDVQVGLIGVTHPIPRDLDILLVAPDGHGVVLMSDVCGGTSVRNYTWLFRSTGNFPVMEPTGPCGGTNYLNSNMPGEPDVWPDATGRGDYPLSDWHRKAMNGDWNLYVVDDHPEGSGKIANGWTLQLTTGPADTFVPGAGTNGPGDPYPSTLNVTGRDNQVITNLAVQVHPALDRAVDLEMLLEGPHGQHVMLMANACSAAPFDHSILFDDRASAPLPPDCSATAAQPSYYGPVGDLPGPAPKGPYEASLSAFNGTTPNGEWKLYAYDANPGGDGYILDKPQLSIDTRPPATVTFGQSVLAVREGSTQSVQITRSAATALGPADVTVTSAPGSAASNADFTPTAQTVHFDRGESRKTVTLDAIDDGAAEPDETYSVTLSDPHGDAQLGTQTQLDVTIPASADKPDTGPHPRPVPVPRCDGKTATIVGTAGKDVLHGTRRADVIVGLAGNDTVTAAKGNDVVCGGPGKDAVSGGPGRDRLFGGPGNDRLTGGAGRDTCLGGRGRNRVTCERKAAR
jgi:subtilisin-like proprotein convertase family protein